MTYDLPSFLELSNIVDLPPPLINPRKDGYFIYDGDELKGIEYNENLVRVRCYEVETFSLDNILKYSKTHFIRTFSFYSSTREKYKNLGSPSPIFLRDLRTSFSLLHLAPLGIRNIRETIIRRDNLFIFNKPESFISLDELINLSEMLIEEWTKDNQFILDYFFSISKGFILNNKVYPWDYKYLIDFNRGCLKYREYLPIVNINDAVALNISPSLFRRKRRMSIESINDPILKYYYKVDEDINFILNRLTPL